MRKIIGALVAIAGLGLAAFSVPPTSEVAIAAFVGGVALAIFGGWILFSSDQALD